jgi:ABC-type antimicrobial peptide transport system permease subunit
MFFGLLAALLVATGLYATLAYTVSRRTSEVGVRMALGAQRSQVLWMILRGSFLVTLIGVVIGLPLAIAATKLLRSVLFGVTSGDPITFVAATIGIGLVAFLASLIPALRAATVDPLVALRYE